ncbi:NAD(P)/FAD-dependent oxidoreductase [Cohnella thermotolerans]|uniref:NAD(P)/FAD-dependent oxidoreductase n=1 Tax=Cohnella thermotolerans TaxID=329858 RepID=UPI000424C155|nr:NAD(P)/FAD-dependent oxidoreductase [Cohnella thermotolerans]
MRDSDLIVIGGGPAGLFACFYGGMRNASVTLIESLPQLGGQLAALYPEKYIYDVAGFPKVTAQELVNGLAEQMSHFPIDVRLDEQVLSVKKLEERKFEVTTDKETLYAKAVIIAGGIGVFSPKRLGLEGSEKYERTNLHYTVTDLERFRGKRVLISGGGDSAVDWALMLEPIAGQVTLVHRRDKFRAHEHSITRLEASAVRVKTPWEIGALEGEERIERVTLVHASTGARELLETDDVIVSFGFVSQPGPIMEWGLAMDGGSILVDSRMETNVPGIFAAGDITAYDGKLKLIVVGFGEAATAVNNAKTYIDPGAKLSPGHSSNMKR